MADARTVFEGLKAGLDVRAGGRIVAARADALSSGFGDLDAALAGGFPRGSLAALEGAASSGRTALLAGALAQTTKHGMAAVLDDGWFYPPAFERAGVQLDRLLIVDVRDTPPKRIARSADILLRSRVFAVVVMPDVQLHATVWSRLTARAQKAGSVLFVTGAQASSELAYFASTRVRCAIERVFWSGPPGALCELAGYDVAAYVCKSRRSAPGVTARLHIIDEREDHAALRSRARISLVRSTPRLRSIAGSSGGAYR